MCCAGISTLATCCCICGSPVLLLIFVVDVVGVKELEWVWELGGMTMALPVHCLLGRNWLRCCLMTPPVSQGESTMFIFNIFPEVFSKEYNNADLPREAVDILVTLIGSGPSTVPLSLSFHFFLNQREGGRWCIDSPQRVEPLSPVFCRHGKSSARWTLCGVVQVPGNKHHFLSKIRGAISVDCIGVLLR